MKIRKLDFFITLILLDLDKFLDLSKNIILLFLFSSPRILLFILLIVLSYLYLIESDKIFIIKINNIIIILKS